MGSTVQLNVKGKRRLSVGLFLMLVEFVAGHIAFAVALPSAASIGWLAIYVSNVFLNIAHYHGWLSSSSAVALGSAAVLAPHLWIGNDEAALRGVVALASAFYFLRLVACCDSPIFGDDEKDGDDSEQEPVSQLHWLERVAHVQMSFHDIRKCMEPVPRWTRSFRCLVLIALDAAIMIAGQNVPDSIAGLDLGHNKATYVGAALQIWASLRLFGHILEFNFAFFAARRAPTLMKNVFCATSLREFWGVRWNVVIQDLLKTKVYVPLIRGKGWSRGWASIATFTASGLLHVFPIWAATRNQMLCGSMLGYFLAQVRSWTGDRV